MTRSLYRHPWLWLAGVLLTVVPSLFLAVRLTIQSDFSHLLPATKPSVIELNRIIERVGGISSLIVAVECDDYRATERFIDDLAVRLKKLPSDYVRYVEHNIKDIRSFFLDNKYLYVDLEDLQEIHRRLTKKIRYEKLSRNPFYLALDEDKAEFDLTDIENKYKGKTSPYDNYVDGYFFSANRKLAAVVIRPYGASTGTAFARKLLSRVEGVVKEMNPAAYHPSMKIFYTGKFKKTLDEYSQLIRDVLETLGLCLLLVAGVLYLYFLRFRVIWLLTMPLAVGVAWTFALAKLQIGYLNSQTAFLGSIIIGNGINTGIILLARYMEERRKNRSVEECIHTAIHQTWLGTLTAALTTSASFAALGFSEIAGFNQFGFIGGFGMTFCWIATYTVLPPLVVITEKLVPMIRDGTRFVSKQWEAVLYPIGALVYYFPRIVLYFGALLVVASVVEIVRFMPDSLEYNFGKLRNRTRSQQMISDGSITVSRAVDDIFGQDLSPVVILLDRESQSTFVCDAVMRLEASDREEMKTIESCKTLRSFLPDRQDEKLKVLADTRRLLADSALNFIQPKYRKELDKFRRELNLKNIALTDLPESMKRNFRELDGTLGRFAYVYPRRGANLSNGRRLIRFVGILSDVRLDDGSVVRMSGESAIFADLLKAIRHDGPIATVFSFLAVTLLVILNFRRKRPIIYIVGGLTVGMLFMFGLQSFLQIRLNFFNFIAIPVTFGIGVDYGCNLFQRYSFEGRGSIRRVLGTVGGAIILCSLTTLIGYATLLTAMNQALASFGWLALIGEMACLFSAIVIMPAVLHVLDRRQTGDIRAISDRKSSQVEHP